MNEWSKRPFRWWLRHTRIGQWVYFRTNPNFWSFIRIPLSLVVWLLLATTHDQTALIVFIIAALTDRFDGVFADLKGPTKFGAMLDSLADSIMMFTVLAGLSSRYPSQALPYVIIGLEIARLSAVGFIGLLPRWEGRDEALDPNLSGKFKMFAVALSVVSVFSGHPLFGQTTMIAAIILSLYSMGRHLFDLLHRKTASGSTKVHHLG
ncbi:MAG: CDP-alcohol phosphatidyltransferase family protein [Candidatus Kerfeldbacteria bacterium]|nr:CDP-alcohol phosphatidyltransferase family protein [Candidatus Kerfeldbacteria bacterium]